MNIEVWFELTAKANKPALLAGLPTWAWCDGDPYVTIAAHVPSAWRLLDFPCRPGLKIDPRLGPLEEAGTWYVLTMQLENIHTTAPRIGQEPSPILLDFEMALKDAFPKHPVTDRKWWGRVRANMTQLNGMGRSYLIYPSTVSGYPDIAACQRKFIDLILTQCDAAPVYCNHDSPRVSNSAGALNGFEDDWDATFGRQRTGVFKINCNNDATHDGKEGWRDDDLHTPFFYTRGAPVILWPGLDRWGDGETVRRALWS